MTAFTIPEIFFRNSIGLGDTLLRTSGNQNYPPCNIIQISPTSWRIVMAVAGFAADHISLTIDDGMLTISGARPAEASSDDWVVLHAGLATRDFERRFMLDRYVETNGATLQDGLLTIDFARKEPEPRKPKSLPIHSI